MQNDAKVAALDTAKKNVLVRVLDGLSDQLNLTPSQYQTARERYEAIGNWLADAESPHLQRSSIYAHGSIALGTAIRPIGRNEFDVDLVCHLPTLGDQSVSAAAVKAFVGERLKAHSMYAGMLEEKKRCWRINYANEFHLDITPSIRNTNCNQGGELVPDRQLSVWKPTNPRGYIKRFEQYAAIRPTLFFREAALDKRADVDKFPDPETNKPFLKLIVQLLKRHRDFAFLSPALREFAPISIIITTLAAWSYAYCSSRQQYADPYDFIVDVIRRMPDFIEVLDRNGAQHYVIKNETTAGENFADKWNQDRRIADAFYRWHQSVLDAFGAMLTTEGTDKLSKHLQSSFGASDSQIRNALASFVENISKARAAGSLVVSPALGVSTVRSPGSTSIPSNNFFGR